MADQSRFGGSLYDTPFTLEKEPGNKFKVREEVGRTMNNSTEIPFLRTPIEPQELSKTHTAGFGFNPRSTQQSYFSGRTNSVKQREKARKIRQQMKKEAGW